MKRKTIITKIAGYFVSLDMPDPRTNWAQMLFSAFFVGLVGFVLVITLIVIAGVPE